MDMDMVCVDNDSDTMEMSDIPAVKSLEDCTNSNTEMFNFKGKSIRSKCVKVYGGGTISVAFMIFGEYYRFRIRMVGYDSPCMRPIIHDPIKKKEHMEWATLSRNFLKRLILNKIVTLKCGDYDMHGRILATVDLDGDNVNDMMIAGGYCRPYTGEFCKVWDFSKFPDIRDIKMTL